LTNTIIDKYDIAISYLTENEELASAIYTELGETFNIFIYTQHQEKIAGENGVEKFRQVFINKTNLIIVLYKNGWGKTEWTSTEEKAIIDFGLKNHWKGILLVNLDGSKTPEWYPNSEIYLDYERYGFDGLIGIIRLRAEERGSQTRTITAVDRAQILEIKRNLQNKKKEIIESEKGVKLALNEVNSLFEEIDRICNNIKSETTVNFEFKREDENNYILNGYKQSDEEGSLGFQVKVEWYKKYGNSLNESKLTLLKVDLGKIIYREQPKIKEKVLFDFDLNNSMKPVWRNNHNNKLISTSELAEEIVKMIIDFKSS